jgi:hypothetical protein
MTPRHVRSMITVGALVGLLVSCGGSDDGADTTDGTPVGTTDGTTVVAPTTTTGDVVVTGAPAESIDPDTALANELMSASVQANLGLPKEQADCAAVFMVDALGADTLIVDGELVDLDTLPAEAQQAAAAAIAEAIPNCGITVSTVPD